ncbi:MAG: hypothetical protein AB3N64_07330 [Puniceicoccaceae bacterium]
MSLESLEKRAYLMYHGDGLADLALGMVVLLFGLGMQFDQTWLAPIFAATAYPLWLAAKRGITEKRLGYVEFSEGRKAKEKRGLIYLFLLGSLTFLLGVLVYAVVVSGGELPGILQQSGYLMLGLIFAVLISSVGLLLGTVRLHAYSAVVILSVVLSRLAGVSREMGIIIPGVIIVSCGTIVLIRFLMRYRNQPSNEENAGDE